MMIPHEDTYWNDADDLSLVDKDPSYKLKVDYMRAHNIVVFRIHDHMHARKPDWIYIGLARALGLESSPETALSHRFTLPETTVEELAVRFQKKLGDQALRVVGDPKAKVSRLQLGWAMRRPPSTIPMWTSW